MKKILFGLVAVLCCLTFAVPAMAKVTMGGMIQLDAFYWSQNDEFANGGLVQNATTLDNGNDRLNLGMPRANNRLDLHYESDDRVLLGNIEYRAGGLNSGTGASTNDTFEMYYAWLDWRPYGDTFHVRAGRQPETFAIMAPGAAGMGHTEFSLLVGFGNLHASNGDMLKFYAKASDMIRFELALQDPNGGAAVTQLNAASGILGVQGAGLPAVAGGPAVRDESVIPRVDLAIPIKIANFTIEPSFTWLNKDFDQVGGAGDDNVDIYGAAVGVRAAFGPVTLSMEATWGQNFANGNYTGAGHAPPANIVPAKAVLLANGEIEDSEYLGGWFQVSFDFGPAAIEAAVGAENIQNDVTSAANDDIDTTRIGYALRVPIKVTKNFTIAPNVIYLDRDDSAEVGRPDGLNVDLGGEWLAGVAFNLSF